MLGEKHPTISSIYKVTRPLTGLISMPFRTINEEYAEYFGKNHPKLKNKDLVPANYNQSLNPATNAGKQVSGLVNTSDTLKSIGGSVATTIAGGLLPGAQSPVAQSISFASNFLPRGHISAGESSTWDTITGLHPLTNIGSNIGKFLRNLAPIPTEEELNSTENTK